MAIAGLTNLCTPSKIYLMISMIALFIIALQNIFYGTTQLYCLGEYSCNVSSTFLIFLIQFVYILFWTWVLNLICRAGATTLAWILVLVPIILFFIVLAWMMATSV